MEKKLIRQRIQALRNLMIHEKIDFYLVPTADYHNSEYVSPFFKAREFLSGFTGSNGTLLVSEEDACLWTDGRYFVQAELELKDTGIRLMRMQEEGVPDIATYLATHMLEGQVLGFDGRVIDAAFGKKLEQALVHKKIRYSYTKDLVAMIWNERPAFPCSKAEVLPMAYCGEDVGQKLSRIRQNMYNRGVSALFLTKLDDLMWLFNLRGDDVACNPVLLSYGFITQQSAILFLQSSALTREVIDYLGQYGVQIRDYHKIFAYLQNYFFQGRERKNCGVLQYDLKNINYAFYCMFRAYGNCAEAENPTELMKAIKTPKEIAFIKDIYLKDSLALTKFIYWLKNVADYEGEEFLTEYSVAKKLDALRKEIPEFLDVSFPTISAYMENAAMMHYEATQNSCKPLDSKGFLLVDSGGQYLGGTTDVTRTIALGEVSEAMKMHFTAVLTGMLRLADAKFLYGCTGRNLDILARSPLWDMGIDYKCGTGHGIGYMLNVHEGPHNIRWRYLPGAFEAVLEEGMLVTDEPGVYLEGQYGIRTENVLLVKKGIKNGDGQFMEFEHLTYVPIDLNAVDVSHLPQKEKEALNAYHKAVYEKLSPYLDKNEKEWLLKATCEI